MDDYNLFFLLLHESRNKGGKRKERKGYRSHIGSMTLTNATLEKRARWDNFVSTKKDHHRVTEDAVCVVSTLVVTSHVGSWNTHASQFFLFPPILLCHFNLVTYLTFFFYLALNCFITLQFNPKFHPTYG